jgi:hypothetical protein
MPDDSERARRVPRPARGPLIVVTVGGAEVAGGLRERGVGRAELDLVGVAVPHEGCHPGQAQGGVGQVGVGQLADEGDGDGARRSGHGVLP